MFKRRKPEASSPEVAPGKETLQKSPRIMVFGTRNSGLFGIQVMVMEALSGRGIEDVGVQARWDAGKIDEDFFGSQEFNQSLPLGVVILPEMRQYHNGTGMFIDGHREYLEKKCNDLGVPHVFLDTYQENPEPFLLDGITGLISAAIPPEPAK